MHSARYIPRHLSSPNHRFWGDSCSILSSPQILTLNKPKIYISIGYLTTFPKKKDFWIFLAEASRSCLTINPCSRIKVKRVKLIIQKPVTYKISAKVLKEIRLKEKNHIDLTETNYRAGKIKQFFTRCFLFWLSYKFELV